LGSALGSRAAVADTLVLQGPNAGSMTVSFGGYLADPTTYPGLNTRLGIKKIKNVAVGRTKLMILCRTHFNFLKSGYIENFSLQSDRYIETVHDISYV